MAGSLISAQTLLMPSMFNQVRAVAAVTLVVASSTKAALPLLRLMQRSFFAQICCQVQLQPELYI